MVLDKMGAKLSERLRFFIGWGSARLCFKQVLKFLLLDEVLLPLFGNLWGIVSA
jgi:hypothetical protein